MSEVRLTFTETEDLAAVLVAHGMDEFHYGAEAEDDHDEWDCRSEVYAIVEQIVAERVAAALAPIEALDDALCDAFMAAKHGRYDGMTAEAHLGDLIEAFRAALTPTPPPPTPGPGAGERDGGGS